MKKLTLYSPSVRNDGSYVDAGATLEVGDAADQIDAARAQEFADSGRGASVTDAKADEKLGAQVSVEA
ncbi:hypothetical protein [Sphingomonas nostoxanthinifaciens]|uniref:hypothetical protein n=1 Tax=Sphingomonas nostoxanthinifaciens TaxID=2872652 RepID=UPI001CC21A2F|nr:hypothetical protein [Sphingomonas nostoxanthinifaciens]UAK24351.1 hypothetical protein K8P63_18895 [Sphingomonas nostoxanthinifaciens]